MPGGDQPAVKARLLRVIVITEPLEPTSHVSILQGKKKTGPETSVCDDPLTAAKYILLHVRWQRQQGTPGQVSVSPGTGVYGENSARACCLAALDGHISPTLGNEVHYVKPRRGHRVTPGMSRSLAGRKGRRTRAARTTFTIRARRRDCAQQRF